MYITLASHGLCQLARFACNQVSVAKANNDQVSLHQYLRAPMIASDPSSMRDSRGAFRSWFDLKQSSKTKVSNDTEEKHYERVPISGVVHWTCTWKEYFPKVPAGSQIRKTTNALRIL